jgi:hypothetical protein
MPDTPKRRPDECGLSSNPHSPHSRPPSKRPLWALADALRPRDGPRHVAPPAWRAARNLERDEVGSLRRRWRMAPSEAHDPIDHIDHIRGHIDHTDVTDADHKGTARAATRKSLSSLIFPRVPAPGRSHRSHRSHGFCFCRTLVWRFASRRNRRAVVCKDVHFTGHCRPPRKRRLLPLQFIPR